jgi:hypothetical protein
MEKQEQGVFLVYALKLIKTEPKRIQPGKPLYFSDREKAEEVIRRYPEIFPFLYEDDSSDERVYCLVMEQFAMDSPYRYQLSTWVFTPEGKYLCDCIIPDDGPFLGRQRSTICHKIGDIVEMPYGERLVLGIVIEQPYSFNEDARDYGFTASDDCYTVINYPDNEVYYAHSPMVFKPSESVSDSVREGLHEVFRQIMDEKGSG